MKRNFFLKRLFITGFFAVLGSTMLIGCSDDGDSAGSVNSYMFYNGQCVLSSNTQQIVDITYCNNNSSSSGYVMFANGYCGRQVNQSYCQSTNPFMPPQGYMPYNSQCYQLADLSYCSSTGGGGSGSSGSCNSQSIFIAGYGCIIRCQYATSPFQMCY